METTELMNKHQGSILGYCIPLSWSATKFAQITTVSVCLDSISSDSLEAYTVTRRPRTYMYCVFASLCELTARGKFVTHKWCIKIPFNTNRILNNWVNFVLKFLSDSVNRDWRENFYFIFHFTQLNAFSKNTIGHNIVIVWLRIS